MFYFSSSKPPTWINIEQKTDFPITQHISRCWKIQHQYDMQHIGLMMKHYFFTIYLDVGFKLSAEKWNEIVLYFYFLIKSNLINFVKNRLFLFCLFCFKHLHLRHFLASKCEKKKSWPCLCYWLFKDLLYNLNGKKHTCRFYSILAGSIK